MNHIFKHSTTVMNRLTNYPSHGCENTNIVDMLVGFLLVISPLLQHYKGFIVNAGILVLILCLPYVCLKLLFRFRSLELKNVLFALPLVLFQVFRVVAHGTSFLEFAHGAVLCGYFVAISLGGVNLKYVARFSYLVSVAAGIGIIIQSICYYVFGFHLQLVATELLLEESNAWVKLAETGTIGITGAASAFYRPSAFFLEPSHMFLYFVPNLFLLLLTPEMNWLKRMSAAILSAGLLLSTSGMGIALVLGAWLLQLGFSSGKENILRIKHLFCKRNILHCIAFLVIFAVIAVSLPFIRYSIMRVFIGNQAVNAIIAAQEAEKAEELAQITLKEQETEEPIYTEAATQTEQQTENNTEVATQTEQQSEETADAAEQAAQLAKEKAEQAAQLAEENAGSTAISGRTERAISLIRYKMSGLQYLIGVSDSVDNIKFNLPGFFATMYKYGFIGTLLSYIFYLCCAVFAKGAYRWMAIIILGVSFFSAHTHGTFYMLFYVLLLMDGMVSKSRGNRVIMQDARID